jgi:hypothetical protein
VAPRAQRRRLTAVIVLVASIAAGCAAAGPRDAISVMWTIDPAPPVVGTPLVIRITLRDRNQTPVTGARLHLEGLMSHPGMAPVRAAVADKGEGVYEAPLQFTMAGDWVVLVAGELMDGTPLKKQIEIAGVRPSS